LASTRHRECVGRALFVAFIAWIALAGCATVGPKAPDASDDPLEPLNRAVFDVNTTLDRTLIAPIARAYRNIVPAFARDRIRSFVDNLAEPRIFVNDMLQGRGDAAATTFARFFLNITAGALGFFDAATDAGLRRQTGDFGQTLYAWGIEDGPFLMLLFFGPSNVRDAIGLGVDLYTPFPAYLFGGRNAWTVGLGIGIVDGTDLRSRNLEVIEEMRKSALDPYTHFRSIFRQYRRSQLGEARGEQSAPEELTDPASEP